MNINNTNSTSGQPINNTSTDNKKPIPQKQSPIPGRGLISITYNTDPSILEAASKFGPKEIKKKSAADMSNKEFYTELGNFRAAVNDLRKNTPKYADSSNFENIDLLIAKIYALLRDVRLKDRRAEMDQLRAHVKEQVATLMEKAKQAFIGQLVQHVMGLTSSAGAAKAQFGQMKQSKISLNIQKSQLGQEKLSKDSIDAMGLEGRTLQSLTDDDPRVKNVRIHLKAKDTDIKEADKRVTKLKGELDDSVTDATPEQIATKQAQLREAGLPHTEADAKRALLGDVRLKKQAMDKATTDYNTENGKLTELNDLIERRRLLREERDNIDLNDAEALQAKQDDIERVTRQIHHGGYAEADLRNIRRENTADRDAARITAQQEKVRNLEAAKDTAIQNHTTAQQRLTAAEGHVVQLKNERVGLEAAEKEKIIEVQKSYVDVARTISEKASIVAQTISAVKGVFDSVGGAIGAVFNYEAEKLGAEAEAISGEKSLIEQQRNVSEDELRNTTDTMVKIFDTVRTIVQNYQDVNSSIIRNI